MRDVYDGRTPVVDPAAQAVVRSDILMATRKKEDVSDLGIVVPDRLATLKAEHISVRLSGINARKLGALAKRLKIGKSAIARLILEKFIAEHDPDAKEKG